MTLRLSRALKHPAITVDLAVSNREVDVGRVRDWIAAEAIAVLNVAGPRDSTAPGIYAQAVRFLEALLSWEGRTNPGLHAKIGLTRRRS